MRAIVQRCPSCTERRKKKQFSGALEQVRGTVSGAGPSQLPPPHCVASGSKALSSLPVVVQERSGGACRLMPSAAGSCVTSWESQGLCQWVLFRASLACVPTPKSV
jgi:hypothetical protein